MSEFESVLSNPIKGQMNLTQLQKRVFGLQEKGIPYMTIKVPKRISRCLGS